MLFCFHFEIRPCGIRHGILRMIDSLISLECLLRTLRPADNLITLFDGFQNIVGYHAAPVDLVVTHYQLLILDLTVIIIFDLIVLLVLHQRLHCLMGIL